MLTWAVIGCSSQAITADSARCSIGTAPGLRSATCMWYG
jgi:hypothetical protein